MTDVTSRPRRRRAIARVDDRRHDVERWCHPCTVHDSPRERADVTSPIARSSRVSTSTSTRVLWSPRRRDDGRSHQNARARSIDRPRGDFESRRESNRESRDRFFFPSSHSSAIDASARSRRARSRVDRARDSIRFHSRVLNSIAIEFGNSFRILAFANDRTNARQRSIDASGDTETIRRTNGEKGRDEIDRSTSREGTIEGIDRDSRFARDRSRS